MRIEALVWDDLNLEHIVRHHVNSVEVEDVSFGSHLVYRGRYGRYILYGRTESGRYLVVVLERLKKGMYRPITAREQIENERALLRRRMR